MQVFSKHFTTPSYANLVQLNKIPILTVLNSPLHAQKVSSPRGRYLDNSISDYSFNVSILSGITIPAASRGVFLLFSSSSAFTCVSSGLSKVP